MKQIETAVIGFQCIERVIKRKHGEDIESEQPVGRRYHVKAAAELLADLARRQGRDAYVQEVIGPAERAAAQVARKGRRAA